MSTESTSAVAPLRQCGRCRLFFPAEPGTPLRALQDWWACTGCRAALIPDSQPDHLAPPDRNP